MSAGQNRQQAGAVGYLTNVYPAVSHSFIKREILALEALGVTVRRLTIRPGATDFPDPTDRAEARLTEVLLTSRLRVAASGVAMMLRHPLRSARALAAALTGCPAQLRAVAARFAYFCEACHLVGVARRQGIAHVHAHFGTNPAAVARLSFLLGGPRYSFTVHGPDEFDQPLAHDLRGKVADAAFAVAISRYGRSQLMRWTALADWPRLQVVRCGLDEAFLGSEPAPITDADVPTFACVARLAPQKGLPVLIEAAAGLKRRGLRFRVLIAGEGELRPMLEQAIAAEDLGDCVTLLGAVSAERVREVILASRAFVLPSFAEGLPVSIMEALALERPVITTRIAGIPELVDEACGALIDAGDAAALGEAMAEMIAATAASLQAKGRVGRARVLAMHDVRASAAQLKALF